MAKVKGLPTHIDIPVLVGTEEEQIIQVKKLPLGKAAELSLVLEGLPKRLKDNPDGKGSKIQSFFEGVDFNNVSAAEVGLALVELLPSLMSVAADFVIELLAVGTSAPKELLEKIGLDEATELLVAIFEVNNIQAIWGNVQKLRKIFVRETQAK
jgi:hypothetical protein